MRRLPLLLLALGAVGTARAQGIRAEPPVSAPVLGSVALGAVGFFGGALIGHGSAEGCSGEWCDLGSTALGALIGETVGVSYGAHLGNHDRGSVGLDLVTSTGVLTMGLLLLSGSNDDSALPEFLLVTGGQIAATVAVERASGRANERKRGLSLSVMPMSRRRIGISASIPLP